MLRLPFAMYQDWKAYGVWLYQMVCVSTCNPDRSFPDYVWEWDLGSALLYYLGTFSAGLVALLCY